MGREEGRLTDYNSYKMPFKEKAFYTLICGAGIFLVAYIFYRSFIACALLCTLALFYPRMKTADIIIKRKSELSIQFKDMLYSLSSSLSAGKSVEMAFTDVLRDMSVIYPKDSTDIIKEIECILRRLKMNETIESILFDFAERSHLEDVENFADVFHTCKRTGGNIIEVIKNTSNIISDKIEIKQEIDTLLAQRRLEQRILNAMPVGMVLILTVSAEDYIAPVFSHPAGRAAMTAALLLLALAFYISKRIIDIRV